MRHVNPHAIWTQVHGFKAIPDEEGTEIDRSHDRCASSVQSFKAIPDEEGTEM